VRKVDRSLLDSIAPSLPSSSLPSLSLPLTLSPLVRVCVCSSCYACSCFVRRSCLVVTLPRASCIHQPSTSFLSISRHVPARSAAALHPSSSFSPSLSFSLSLYSNIPHTPITHKLKASPHSIESMLYSLTLPVYESFTIMKKRTPRGEGSRPSDLRSRRSSFIAARIPLSFSLLPSSSSLSLAMAPPSLTYTVSLVAVLALCSLTVASSATSKSVTGSPPVWPDAWNATLLKIGVRPCVCDCAVESCTVTQPTRLVRLVLVCVIVNTLCPVLRVNDSLKHSHNKSNGPSCTTITRDTAADSTFIRRTLACMARYHAVPCSIFACHTAVDTHPPLYLLMNSGTTTLRFSLYRIN